LDKLYPDTSSNNNGGVNYWKGRKIIPLDKWLKIIKANTISRRENYNLKEGLQYLKPINIVMIDAARQYFAKV
jgi:hypothetical protein